MKSLLVKFLIVLLSVASVESVCAEEIAVLMSSDAAIYQEALEGFREVVRNRTINVQTLADRRDEWPDQLKKLRMVIEPDLIFVIGTPALQAVSAQISRVPIVHAMVFNPFGDHISSGRNITGISMIPSADKVMSLIKELNPNIRRVGVMYDPARSGLLYSKAQSAAQKENIRLIDRKIRSPGEIAVALKSFESGIDLLWLWPDERFLANEVLQRILLFSFENKIPVLGLSEQHTQMGAFLSLSYGSAKDMGKQAGELVNKMLGMTGPPAAGLVVPRQVKLTVNLKTAGKLDIEVPGSIIRRADNAVKAPVYKEGDWWVFRIKTFYPEGRAEIEDHRVIYRNGKFETKYPRFLRGEDLPATATFLPFASVYVEDPHRKFLDFPLLAGKKWTFWYRRRYYGGRGSITWAWAEAEAIGRAPHPIDTPAGQFEAIEIQRVDFLSHPVYLTYFYSPQTKSVIRVRASVTEGSGRRFELDLIAYGTAVTGKASAR